MAISGGAPSPQPIDYQAQANAQFQIERQRAELAEQNRVAEEQRKAAEDARLQEEFNANLGAARTDAFGRVQGAFNERGLDPNNYASLIESSLGDVARGIPKHDPNPGSYFSNSIADTILGKARESDQRGFSQQFDSFAPTGFAANRIGSGLDDGILESILASQYDDANSQILRAHQRGQLNDTGYQSALGGLENQRSAGQAQLTSIGDSVLEQGRGGLRSIAEEGRQGLEGYQLGQSFNPDAYRSRIDDNFNQFSTGLEGNIRSAVGGQNFFDIPSLIGRGGVAQGVTNNPQNPSLAAAFQRREEDRQQGRGLGTKGAF